MRNPQTTTTLENLRIAVHAKLAAAWTSFMFLYIYVDYLALYKPGFLDDILAGTVHEFDIGPTLIALGLTLIAIPSLMIVLSMTLPARVNRAINLVVAPRRTASPATLGASLDSEALRTPQRA